MSQKHNHGEEGGEAQEKISHTFVFPEYESEEKRQTGVPREEQIIAGKNTVKSFSVEKHRSYDRMGGEWADMGETDKNRPYQNKNRHTLESKRHIINMSDTNKNANDSQNHRSPDEDTTHIVDPGVGQNNIGNGSTGGAGDVAIDEKLGY